MEPRIRHIATQERFSGKIFSVRSDLVEINGEERRFDVVDHPGSYAVIATPEPGKILLVRQYRHPAARMLWEIPAGCAHSSETPEAGARRELQEETGYAARSMRSIFSAYASPGFCAERMHFFHADDLQAGSPNPDDDEDLEVRTLSLETARSMQADGDIVDMKTILAIVWLSERFRSTDK